MAAGALLATVTGARGHGRAGEAAVADGDAHADEVAPVAVAGGGEVEGAPVAPAMSVPLRVHW